MSLSDNGGYISTIITTAWGYWAISRRPRAVSGNSHWKQEFLCINLKDKTLVLKCTFYYIVGKHMSYFSPPKSFPVKLTPGGDGPADLWFPKLPDTPLCSNHSWGYGGGGRCSDAGCVLSGEGESCAGWRQWDVSGWGIGKGYWGVA